MSSVRYWVCWMLMASIAAPNLQVLLGLLLPSMSLSNFQGDGNRLHFPNKIDNGTLKKIKSIITLNQREPLLINTILFVA